MELFPSIANSDRFLPNNENETAFVTGNGVIGPWCVDHQRARWINLVLVSLRTGEHKNVLIACMVVVRNLSTGLVAQQSSGGACAVAIEPINFYSRSERLPGKGICAIAKRPDIRDDEGGGRHGLLNRGIGGGFGVRSTLWEGQSPTEFGRRSLEFGRRKLWGFTRAGAVAALFARCFR